MRKVHYFSIRYVSGDITVGKLQDVVQSASGRLGRSGKPNNE